MREQITNFLGPFHGFQAGVVAEGQFDAFLLGEAHDGGDGGIGNGGQGDIGLAGEVDEAGAEGGNDHQIHGQRQVFAGAAQAEALQGGVAKEHREQEGAQVQGAGQDHQESHDDIGNAGVLAHRGRLGAGSRIVN